MQALQQHSKAAAGAQAGSKQRAMAAPQQRASARAPALSGARPQEVSAPALAPVRARLQQRAQVLRALANGIALGQEKTATPLPVVFVSAEVREVALEAGSPPRAVERALSGRWQRAEIQRRDLHPEQALRRGILRREQPGLKRSGVVHSRGFDRATLAIALTQVAPWSKTGGLGDVVGEPAGASVRGARGTTCEARYRRTKKVRAVLPSARRRPAHRARQARPQGHHRRATVRRSECGASWGFWWRTWRESEAAHPLRDIELDIAHRSRARSYDQYSDAWDTSVVITIDGEPVRFFHSIKKGVHRVWVDHPWFLAKVRRELV